MDIFTYVHSEVINKMEIYFKFTIINFKYFSYIITQYPLIIDFYKVIFQVLFVCVMIQICYFCNCLHQSKMKTFYFRGTFYFFL